MKIRKEITRRELDNMHPRPCYYELNQFQIAFGNRAAFTIDNAKLAAQHRLAYWWLATRLFDGKTHRRFTNITYILRKRHHAEGKGLSPDEELQIGWAAFAATALDLKIKPTGWSFDALGERRDFLTRWFGKDARYAE